MGRNFSLKMSPSRYVVCLLLDTYPITNTWNIMPGWNFNFNYTIIFFGRMDCIWTPVFFWDLTAAIQLQRRIKYFWRNGIQILPLALQGRPVTVHLPRRLLSADLQRLLLSCRSALFVIVSNMQCGYSACNLQMIFHWC